MVALQDEFVSVPLSLIFWNYFLRRVGINYFLYVWYKFLFIYIPLNSPMKPSGPGLLFAGSFYYFRFYLF